MKVTYDNKERKLMLEIKEEIDHHMAEKIRNRADYEIQKYMPKQVVLDFEDVTFMDSAGIGMIIGRYKTAKMFGGNLEIINVKPNVKKIFEMAGVLKLVPIAEEKGGK